MSSMNLDDFRYRDQGLGAAAAGGGILTSLIGIVPALAEAGAVGFSTYATSETSKRDQDIRRREFTATLEQRQRELEVVRQREERDALEAIARRQSQGNSLSVALGTLAILAATGLVLYALKGR